MVCGWCVVGDTILIDECDAVVVCITRAYIEKYNRKENDNCKLELDYAWERKGGKRLIPIVMAFVTLKLLTSLQPMVRSRMLWVLRAGDGFIRKP